MEIDSSYQRLDILDGEEIKANESNKRDLIQFIASTEAILFVGAGCSSPTYPDWMGLKDHFETEIVALHPDFEGYKKDESLFKFFQRCKDRDSELYSNIIFRLFKYDDLPSICDDRHLNLVKIPFRGIVTTNYDHIIEAAFFLQTDPIYAQPVTINSENRNGIEEVTKFLSDLCNPVKTGVRRIMHLHGYYNQQSSIILSFNEYAQSYNLMKQEPPDKDGWSLHRKIIWALLATRRVVFIGFSLTDEYFNMLLDVVKVDLRTYYSKRHFAVFAINARNKEKTLDNSRRLEREYGIVSVFYEDDGSYSQFGVFVKALEYLVRQYKNPNDTTKETDSTIGNVSSHGDLKVNKRLIEIMEGKLNRENEDQ